jgi:hypothetical protein
MSEEIQELVEDIEEAVDDLKELVDAEDEVEVKVEDEIEDEFADLWPIDFTDPAGRARFQEYKARNAS